MLWELHQNPVVEFADIIPAVAGFLERQEMHKPLVKGQLSGE